MADGRDLPARLDRSALERVLARAAELQASELDPGEYISEDRLLDIAKEVGLAPHHMRQALAEERTRVAVPEETGAVARFAGVARVIATRVVAGQPSEVLASLDTWMQREECLTTKRRFPDRIVWEEHRGFWTQLRRGMDMGGRRYVLARAHEVGATAVPVDDQRALVRLEADLSNVRTGRLAGAGASTAVGVAASDRRRGGGLWRRAQPSRRGVPRSARARTGARSAGIPTATPAAPDRNGDRGFSRSGYARSASVKVIEVVEDIEVIKALHLDHLDILDDLDHLDLLAQAETPQ